MFLTRFWRDRIVQLESRVGELEKANSALTARVRERESLLKDQTTLFSQQAKAFEKVSDQYVEGLQRARQTIAELQAQAAQAPVIRANQPLHMTEEEEDAHYMLEAGRINMEEYNDVLRNIGLGD